MDLFQAIFWLPTTTRVQRWFAKNQTQNRATATEQQLPFQTFWRIYPLVVSHGKWCLDIWFTYQKLGDFPDLRPFQVPKPEVLYHIKPYFGAYYYIALTVEYGRQLQVRFQWPLTGGLEHFLFFHILGMSSSQLLLTPSFFRGVETNHQPDIYIYMLYLCYWYYNHYS